MAKTAQFATPTFSLLKTLIVLLWITNIVLAQAPPSNPQPGIGAVPQPTNDSSDKKKIGATTTTTTASSSSSSSSGAAGGAGGGAAVMTTVTVISGTTTTITIAPSAHALAPAGAVTGTPTVPKAVQSVIVIASTTYGRALPAAGPADDEIESHFWDQFKPRPAAGGGGSTTGLHDPISSLLITQTLAMGLVMVAFAIDML